MRNNPLMEPIGNAYDKGLNRLIYGDPASVLGAGASVAGGVLGSDSSSSAADAQSQASAASIAEQRRQYDQARTDTAPYRNSGVAANNLLDDYLGTGGGMGGTSATASFQPLSYNDWSKTQNNAPAPVGGRSLSTNFTGNLGRNNTNSSQSAYQQYLASHPATQGTAGTNQTFGANHGSLLKPFSYNDLNNDVVYNTGLQFGLDEGTKSIDHLASASGRYESGATLKALARYANDYGTTKAGGAYDRFVANKDQTYNFLNGVANRGVNAVGTVTGAGQNSANNVSTALEGAGNARAAGIIGGANAWSGALGGIAKQIPSNSSIFNPASNQNYSSQQYDFTTGGYK